MLFWAQQLLQVLLLWGDGPLASQGMLWGWWLCPLCPPAIRHWPSLHSDENLGCSPSLGWGLQHNWTWRKQNSHFKYFFGGRNNEENCETDHLYSWKRVLLSFRDLGVRVGKGFWNSSEIHGGFCWFQQALAQSLNILNIFISAVSLVKFWAEKLLKWFLSDAEDYEKEIQVN